MPKPRIDFWLLLPAMCLSLLGLLILRSIVPELLANQLLFFAVFVIIFILFSLVDYRIIFSLHLLVFIVSLVFLVLPFFFGVPSRGAVRWLQLGNFSLQPSEVVKPFLLVTFVIIATSQLPRKILLLILALAAPLLIIFLQPDLGSAIVLFVGWFTIFLSLVPPYKFLPLGLVGLLLFFPAYKYILKDYQRQRLMTYVNPYADPLGQGYHIIQSLIAVGSGGLFGRGLGHGTQSQLRFLPEHHTDFIFASLAEELGFAGSLVVIILLLSLLWRIYRISQQTSDPKAALFCLSAASLLAFQAAVNIGMNSGLVPITGITLPFLSYGGSSLLSLAITLGLIHSISLTSRSYNFPKG